VTDIFSLTGIGQRQATFRFQVLDQGLSGLGDIYVEGYQGRIENNINRTVKRTMSSVILPLSDVDALNPLTNRLRPWMIMQDGTQWPLGAFVFSDYHRLPYSPGWFSSATDLTDQGIILDQPTARTYTFGPNYPIGNAIQDMLDGLITQYQIDPVTVSVPGNESMTWPPGTSRLAIINDLCAAAGMYSLYFDNMGVAIVRRVPDLASAEPTLRYGSAIGEQSVFRDSIVESDDLLSAPNRYIITSNSMNQDVITGFWDVPPSSPNSKEMRGFVVASVSNRQGIESSEAATAAAMAWGQSDYNTYKWATFDAAINPQHDTFDIVAWNGSNYREQAWAMDMSEGGNHKHELRRIYAEAFA
jgi:hypothetical protein